MIIPKVIVDDYEGAFEAGKHLIKIGRKLIAHLSGPSRLAISRKRLNGYLDAFQRHSLPIDEELIISYGFTLAKVTIYVKHLLSLECLPDAIFAINDPTAIEAIKIIKKSGLKIP